MEDWLSRERALIGDDNVKLLKSSSVMIFGLGGVGGAALEALVRAGIGTVVAVDHDVIGISNLNRQIIADTTNIGQAKVTAAKERMLKINPELRLIAISKFVNADNVDSIIDTIPRGYIIDAIDTVTSKLCIIKSAKERDVKIISCMGTGNKTDPSKFKIADINKTSVCPLARVMRRELRELGINRLDVLYSEELPIKSGERTPASISFVPPVAGYMIAGRVINDIIS